MFGAFQTRVPASTPFLRDPRGLRVAAGHPNSTYYAQTGGTAPYQRTAPEFWSYYWNNQGAYSTSDPTTGTRTITNITARGKLFGLIGPSGVTTVTFTVTVDGVPYTLGPYNPGSSGVVFVGDILEHRDRFTVQYVGGGVTNYQDVVTRTTNNIFNVQDYWVLKVPQLANEFVKFDTSLKVDVSATGTVSGTNGAYTGALFCTD